MGALFCGIYLNSNLQHMESVAGAFCVVSDAFPSKLRLSCVLKMQYIKYRHSEWPQGAGFSSAFIH